MATYITLARYTQQGIANVKDSPARVDAARKAFRAAGADIKDLYLVTGPYDLIFVSEAPDDETIAKLSLPIGALGNVRTETYRAFSEDEFRKIIGTLP